ncbi:MAG: XisI protein [Phormidium tanganyikae FI6-MK23]|jgi:hypothetical protein|nr:XisI protein [Phormidium tanganyikae FI6-MK23]
MDTRTQEHERDIIEKVLTDYAAVPYANSPVQTVPVFDRQRDRYLLMNIGWEPNRYNHGCLIHIDLIGNKLWVQRDGTEEGIAMDLEAAGIPKERIVLGFKPPEV